MSLLMSLMLVGMSKIMSLGYGDANLQAVLGVWGVLRFQHFNNRALYIRYK